MRRNFEERLMLNAADFSIEPYALSITRLPVLAAS
jgi:hypothetical protein